MIVHEIIPDKLFQRGRFADMQYKMEYLEDLGVDVVVCMINKYDPDMEQLFAYVRIPMGDSARGLEQNANELLVRSAELAVFLEHDHAILSHCYAGRNRSGLINALIARHYLRISGTEALDLVRRERPNAIATSAFEDFLHGLSVPTIRR